MRAVPMIIGACIVILLLGAVLAGITVFRSGEYVEPHNVTTGAGVTTSDVVLTQALLDDGTNFATISSNLTGDAAVPSSYVSATKTLSVGGLLESQSRQLEVTYRYNQLSSYWAADILCKMWPVLLGLGVVGIIVGSVITANRGGD